MGPKWNPAWRLLPVSTVSEIRDDFHRFDIDIKRPCNEEQITNLGIGYRLAFAQMLAGAATGENWAMVCCSMNIAIVLADHFGIGTEFEQLLVDALAGVSRAKQRGARTGKYGFDGRAIQAIQDAFDVHEAQIRIATKEQLVEAVKEVHRRTDAGIAYMEAA